MEQQDVSDGTKSGPLSNQQFLELMNRDAAKDLVKSINTFLKDFRSRQPSVHVSSRHVQAFLQSMEIAMAKHPLWANSTPQDQNHAMEALEKYVMAKLYDRTFGASPEDVERDQLLDTRMKALQFVRPEHLEIPVGLVDDGAVATAVKELNKMNQWRCPRDKLVCILNCCRVVSNLLEVSSKSAGAAGADDFTPLLIYVVIRAQPEALASNLAFIERFRMASKLTGEHQYYYIQLAGAATFIEMINATSLKVNPDEFISHMLQHGAMTDEQLALMQRTDSGQRAAAGADEPGGTRAAGDMAALGGPPPATQTPVPATASTALPSGAQQGAGMPQGETAAIQGSAELSSAPLHSGVVAGGMPPPAGQDVSSFLPPLTVAELEAQGASLLAKAGSSSSLAHHLFAFTPLERLTVGDVPGLLEAYKELVIKYEVLAAALRWHQQQRDHHAASASAPPVTARAAGPGPAAPPGSTQAAPVPHAPPMALSPAAQVPQLQAPSTPKELPPVVPAPQVQPPATAPPPSLRGPLKDAEVAIPPGPPREHTLLADALGDTAAQDAGTVATAAPITATAPAAQPVLPTSAAPGSSGASPPAFAHDEHVGSLPQDLAQGPDSASAALQPSAEQQPMQVQEEHAGMPPAAAAVATVSGQEFEDFFQSPLQASLPRDEGAHRIPAASPSAEGGATAPAALEDLLGDLLCSEPSTAKVSFSEAGQVSGHQPPMLAQEAGIVEPEARVSDNGSTTSPYQVPSVYTGESQPPAHNASLLD